MLGLVTYFGILIALAIGSWRRPAIAFAGVLCLSGLKQWAQNSTELLAAPQNRLITNVVIGLLTLAAVVRVSFMRGCLFCRFPPAAIFVVATYIYAMTSTAWSIAPPNVLSEVWTFAGVYAITVTFLSPLLISNLSDVRLALMWALYAGGTICFLALTFGSWGIRGLTLPPGADVAETNPLALASLGGTVALAASMFLLEKRHALLRLIALACIPLALALILKSGSRGQLIALIPAFAIGGAIAFRLNSARSLVALFVTTTLFVGLGWWASTLVDFDSLRWTATQSATEDVHGRFDMASQLLKAAASHPLAIIFGLGNSSSYEVLGIYPHIPILEVIAEEGIPGILLYLGILICAVRSIVRIARSPGQDDTARKGIALLAGLFVFELVCSQKQGTLITSVHVYAYAIILGRVELSHAGKSLRAVSTVIGPQRMFPNLMS